MRIYSEITGQNYATVEACQAAEIDFNNKLALKKAEQNKLSLEKKTRADAVAAAYKTVKDAEKAYLKLRNEFVKDYGYFHMTYRDSDAIPNVDIFDMFRIF